MFGGDWEPEDFEPPATKVRRPACPKCGKKFGGHIGVRDHMRDKHGEATTQEPTP